VSRVDEVGGDIEIDVEKDDQNDIEALWNVSVCWRVLLVTRIILSRTASYILSILCFVSLMEHYLQPVLNLQSLD
jgi:hypothetical protein